MNPNVTLNGKTWKKLFVFFLLALERDGFCQNPFFECLVAEVPEEHKSKEGKV